MESLSNLAKSRIGHSNPFPLLDGFGYGDVCKWGLTDLYPEFERTLREAIGNRLIFDTRWCSCKKEIRSFRMISDGIKLTIQASEEMDDFPDLIYDAVEDGVELTDEQEEALSTWFVESDLQTYTESERTIPLTTYEDAMEVLGELEQENRNRLHEWFEVVKSWVEEVRRDIKE